jgi:HEAT repeat protein
MIAAEWIESLQLPEAGERRIAVEEIVESGDAEVESILLGQLAIENSRAVKEAILRGLSQIWKSGPLEPVVELLKDGDPFVRAEAIEVLVRRADDAAGPLAAIMAGDDKDLRKFAVEILSRASQGVPDPMYREALGDADMNVVISTVEYIGEGRRISLVGAVADLAVHHSHPMVVCACLETLALIGNEHSLSVLRGRYASAASGVPPVCLPPFLKVLGSTAGPEAVKEICEVLEGGGRGLLETALDALARLAARHRLSQLDPCCADVLCGLLDADLQAPVRFRLVRLLGRFAATRRVALALAALLNDPDGLVASSAAESLEDCADADARALLHLWRAGQGHSEVQAAGNGFPGGERDGSHL